MLLRLPCSDVGIFRLTPVNASRAHKEQLDGCGWPLFRGSSGSGTSVVVHGGGPVGACACVGDWGCLVISKERGN